MSIKTKLPLAALCFAISGAACAVTPVANGTITLGGTIGASTCAVAPSATSITFAELSPAAIDGLAANAVADTQKISFDFTGCTSLPDEITLLATANTAGATDARGGFTYAATADKTNAPLEYAFKKGDGKYLQVSNGASADNDIDISAENKAAFSIPLDIELVKTSAAAGTAGTYSGTYSASVAWAVEYP